MPEEKPENSTTQKAAEIIDPMAWAAWEVDLKFETRRKVSLVKAEQILALKDDAA